MITWFDKTIKEYIDFTKDFESMVQFYKTLKGREKKAFRKKLDEAFKDLRCPHCGAIGQLKRYSSYLRDILFFSPMWELRGDKVIVPRVKCESCESTHAILSTHIAPYQVYLVDSMLLVCHSYVLTTSARQTKAIRFNSSALPASDRPVILPKYQAMSMPQECTKEQLTVLEISYDASSHIPQAQVYDSFVTPSGIEILSPREDISMLMAPYGLGPASFFLPDNRWETQIAFYRTMGDGGMSLYPVAGVSGKSAFVSSAIGFSSSLENLSAAKTSPMIPALKTQTPFLFEGKNRKETCSFRFLSTADLQEELAQAIDFNRLPLIYGTTNSSGIWLPSSSEATFSYAEDISDAKVTLLNSCSLQEQLDRKLEEIFRMIQHDQTVSSGSTFAIGKITPPTSPDMREWVSAKNGEVFFWGEDLPQQVYSRSDIKENSTFLPVSTLYKIVDRLCSWMGHVDHVLRHMGMWDSPQMIGIKEAVPILLSIPLDRFQKEMFRHHSMPFLFPYERRTVSGFPYTGCAY